MKRLICTDLVVFSLAHTSSTISESLKRHLWKLNFSFVGAFTPDDVKYLAENEKGLFSVVYPNKED